MTLCRPWLSAFTALLLAACTSEPSPPAAPPTDESTTPSDSAIAASVRDALGEGEWDARYFDARVDLDGDGRQEILALVAGPMVCGTGGCPVFVFTPQVDGYRLVERLTVVQPPVRVSSSRTNGWRNLVVGIGGGGLPAGHAELAFDGTTYPSNPTVEPARRINDLSATEILIPEFESYRDGKPLSGAGSHSLPPDADNVYGDPATPVAGQVHDTVIHTQDADELRYVVLRVLTDRYADARGIDVSDAEIDAYVATMSARLQRDREEHAARRDELTRQLTGADLSQAQRESPESELDTVNELLTNLSDESDDGAVNRQEIEAARREIAAAFIRQWKINRTLYQEYGGRIVYQQGGPEPLDAYRTFLEQHQANGDFAIRDKGLEDSFWRYYRDETIHDFYPPGSKEESQAFARPWWESSGN